VFADVDRQREVVEDPRGTEDDRRAEELQERRHFRASGYASR
jgi:hypothetical protein